MNNNNTVCETYFLENKIIKLNIACGDMILKDYINIDLYNNKADIKADALNLPFDDNSVDEILASHIIEHFNFHEGFKAIKEWYRVLKEGGKLVIECPDLLSLCHKFIEADEQEKITMYYQFFGSPWLPGHLHKFIYTATQMRWTLEKTNYRNIIQVKPHFYSNIIDRCMRFECVK
jgi:predicted SAM-dependent methyltransferase